MAQMYRRTAEVFGFEATPCMVEPKSTPSREASQELFVRASARRAERRRFVDTLREILERRDVAIFSVSMISSMVAPRAKAPLIWRRVPGAYMRDRRVQRDAQQFDELRLQSLAIVNAPDGRKELIGPQRVKAEERVPGRIPESLRLHHVGRRSRDFLTVGSSRPPCPPRAASARRDSTHGSP